MPEHTPYLSGLRLQGRRVVVVGGGRVAQRRLPALLAAGADVTVVAPAVSPAVEGLGGQLHLELRPYRPGDLADAWYALALTDDPAVNAAVAAEAESRRVFCVRADDAALGTALTPATGGSEGVQVGVVTAPGPSRRRDPHRAVAVREFLLEALHDGRVDAAARSLADDALAGTVALVGGGPGAVDLITVRGRRLLARADVVVADRLGPRALLGELRDDVVVVDASKLPRGHQMPQEAITACLLEHARAGRFVVRLKGGDPYVFGRGSEEAAACAAAGVPVQVVPGVTSAISVPGATGIPFTHRGVAHEAVVVSGHVAPDDPTCLVDWSALARLRGTVVVLMGVHNLAGISRALVAGGRPEGTPVALVEDGTMATERVTVSTLGRVVADAAAAGVRPPAIIVVGDVVALRDEVLGLAPAAGAAAGAPTAVGAAR